MSDCTHNPVERSDNCLECFFCVRKRLYKSHGANCWHWGLIKRKQLEIRNIYHEKAAMFTLDFENTNEIGSYLKLTNSYCLAAAAHQPSANEFADALNQRLPVIFTEIAGCRIVGRLCVGNKHGLVVTDKITDLELEHLHNNLPDGVKISCVEERLSALGNVVACNDKVAIIHEDIDQDTEEIIRDTLNVEVFRHRIGEQALVGSYCALNNIGGLVHSKTTTKEIDELSELLDLPITAGTVNRGKDTVGSGIAVSDYCGIAGTDCRPHELVLCDNVFGFNCTRRN